VELLRPGSDVAILGLGPGTQLALKAADLLGAQGIAATVANVRRVHPLDAEGLLGVVAGHRAVVTVEDNALAGGFGSAVLELLAQRGRFLRVARAGIPDAFVTHGKLDVLRDEIGLTAESIAATAARLLADSARCGD
jgi:1-deoxy-D-xylulose-5-phosphate synthase